MKYNKDNINGIKFQYKGEGDIWTIDVGNAYVVDSIGTKSSFQVHSMVDYLNKGLWIPVKQKEDTTKPEIQYEIY